MARIAFVGLGTMGAPMAANLVEAGHAVRGFDRAAAARAAAAARGVPVVAGLAARDLSLLDAPVTGGPGGAEAGTLGIMVGGEPEAFERARPILEALGRPRRMGPPGAGQATKLCNQIVVAQHLVAVAEALTLARAAGLDEPAVLEVLGGGAARSWLLETFGARMAAGEGGLGHHAVIRVFERLTGQEPATEAEEGR